MNINSNNLPQSTELTKVPKTRPESPQMIENAPTITGQSLSEAQRKQVFDKHQMLTAPTETLPEDQVIEQGVEQTQPQTLVQNAEQVPPPRPLNESRQQVLAQTVHLANFSEEAWPNFGPLVRAWQQQDANWSGDENQQRRADSLKEMLGEHFKPLLKELSAADGILGSGNKISRVQDQGKQEMLALLSGLGHDDHLSLLLQMTPADQRKEVLAQLVGELREGKSRSYDQLSTKKQEFVDAALAGIEAGLAAQKPGHRSSLLSPPSRAMSELRQAVENRLQALTPVQLTQLKQIRDADILSLFRSQWAPTLGDAPLSPQLERNLLGLVRGFTPPVQGRAQAPFVRPLTPEDLLGKGVADALQALARSEDARPDLRRTLLTHLELLGPDHNTNWQLGLMSRDQIAELVSRIAPLKDKDIDWLVNTLRANMPNRIGSGETPLDNTDGAMVNVPSELVLGNKVYTPVVVVGKAAFAVVVQYVNQNDPEDLIALKIVVAQNDPDEANRSNARDTIIAELNLHRELQAQGKQEVIGLRGAIAGPGDKLYMLMEYASGGSVNDLSQSLETAEREGVITRETRELLGLYAVKQMLEGVRYMHDEREMLHLDLKPFNIMLGSDGTLKLIDFGTAQLGTEAVLPNRIVENPLYTAPEQVVVNNGMFPTATVAGKASDIWSIGVSAFALLVGDIKEHAALSGNFSSRVEANLRAYYRTPDTRFMAPEHLGESLTARRQGHENAELDSLLDAMLTPNAQHRQDASHLLQHPLLRDPRLSSDAMRTLFTKLAQPLHPRSPEARVERLRTGIQDELVALGLA